MYKELNKIYDVLTIFTFYKKATSLFSIKH